jgi:ABC-type multidrug transport system ATPase subunit
VRPIPVWGKRLYTLSMPPEHSDWSDRQQPQAGPSAAGIAPAGVAEAAPRSAGSAVPALVVRTRRSDHTLPVGATYTIGRDPAADIVVLDSRVSWRHGTVRVEGNGWLLEDLGSTNGTFVGLQRVDRVPIANETLVRLGNPEDGPILRFVLEASAAAQPGPGLPAAPQPQAQPPFGGSARPQPPQAQPQQAQPPSGDAARPQAPAAQPPFAAPAAQPPFAPPAAQPPFAPPAAQPPFAAPAAQAPFAPPAGQPPFAAPSADEDKQFWPGVAADPPSMSHPAPWWAASPLSEVRPAYQAAAPQAPPAPAREPQPQPQPAPREPVWEDDVHAVDWREPPRPPSQADGGAPEPLPSVDRRPTMRMPLPAKALRIGRVPDNDVVLPDLDVSRHHAELRKSPAGTYEIVDLGSHNGTYVNGRRVSSAVIGEDDIVSIGHSTFRLAGGELRQYEDEGEVSFKAQDLVVRVGGGKVILNHVSFPVPEKSLLGVIGPSGAGKSTLLGALTGMRPADTGTVLYDNRDLYANYAELRYRIGLVPQESVLHTQLTARRALQYSAELRFPADTTSAERTARVDEVMSELGLTRHANTRADRLSGGQLKRVNVAQELLTKPSLLFLDEPTSGLDPGLDKSVMEQMRDLAHDGRTVIVVTHSVANLDTCDRLLVLFPGGKVAYYGPPGDGLSYFGLPGWAEVFQAFERYPDRDWAGEFAASPQYQQYVADRQRPRPVGRHAAPDEPLEPQEQRRGAMQQLSTLTRRYLRVISSDRGYLVFQGLLPIVLGGLIHFVGTSEGLSDKIHGQVVPHSNTSATEVLLMLVICACLAGTASSIRELVKERAIYVRERAAGLSSGAYLFSKLIVLGVISVLQSVVLVLLGVIGEPLPSQGAFLTGLPLVELLIGIAVLGLASMCLGLLVSALVSTSEKAMPVLVLLTMVQVILSGSVLPLHGKTGLSQLAYLAPARWGFGAVASTTNLNVITPTLGNIVDPLWNHTGSNWLRDMGIMIGLAAVFVAVAALRLRRLGPRRRKTVAEGAAR